MHMQIFAYAWAPAGTTYEEIGGMLFISKNTVDRHRANILEKLGMRNRVDLTRYAIRRGLVEPRPDAARPGRCAIDPLRSGLSSVPPRGLMTGVRDRSISWQTLIETHWAVWHCIYERVETLLGPETRSGVSWPAGER
jgi:DNA-binding CsgD family transcriptional regulator